MMPNVADASMFHLLQRITSSDLIMKARSLLAALNFFGNQTSRETWATQCRGRALCKTLKGYRVPLSLLGLILGDVHEQASALTV